MKIYNYKHQNKIYRVVLKRDTYSNNNRFSAWIEDSKHEIVTMITVNLDEPLSKDNPNVNFVDTNNAWGIEDFLVKNEIAKFTGNVKTSGFVIYPEYEFDLSKFEEAK